MLQHEHVVLNHLNGIPGIPTSHWFGRESGHSALVLDSLGPCQYLEVIFNNCGRSFSLSTVAWIASQMVMFLCRLSLLGTDLLLTRSLVCRTSTRVILSIAISNQKISSLEIVPALIPSSLATSVSPNGTEIHAHMSISLFAETFRSLALRLLHPSTIFWAMRSAVEMTLSHSVIY